MVPRLASAGPLDPALRKRIVAGVLLGALAIGNVLLGGWAFALLLLGAVALMAREWARLARAPDPAAHRAVLGAAALAPAAAIVAFMAGAPATALLVLALGCVASAGLAAALVPAAPVDRVAAGVAYIGAPTLSLLYLDNVAGEGTALVLWLFFVVWATDTFAYIVGRAIGGPRLAPRVSPGKTWAGLFGGVAGAATVGGACALLDGRAWFLAGALAACLAVVAQLGDLYESWLKRRAGLKDSGSLIPGHGGILDRVDGLMFAAPVLAAVVMAGRAAATP